MLNIVAVQVASLYALWHLKSWCLKDTPSCARRKSYASNKSKPKQSKPICLDYFAFLLDYKTRDQWFQTDILSLKFKPNIFPFSKGENKANFNYQHFAWTLENKFSLENIMWTVAKEKCFPFAKI